MRTAIIVIVLLLLASLFAAAQERSQSPPEQPAAPAPPGGMAMVVAAPMPPMTILESWSKQITDAVIVRGYTEIGSVRDDDGTEIRVIAVEFSNLELKDKAAGLAIEVHQRGAGARTTVVWVDEWEIEKLINAIDSLARIEQSTTPMANFDARYRTRGALEVANLNINGTRRLVLTATQILPANGQLVWGTASLPISRAKELQNQIKLAKDALTRTKPAPVEGSATQP